MSSEDLTLLAALLLLIAAASFLAVAEASLLRLTSARAASLADSGDRSAVRLARLLERLPEVLNLILMLALLTQISAATVTGILAQRLFGSLGVTLASIALTVVLFIYGEAIPKTYAIRHAERSALFVARPISVLERLLRPMVSVLVWVADLQMPGKGITTSPTVTEDELRLLAAEAAFEGEITDHDRQLIERGFLFGDRHVDDVMVPRPDIVAADIESGLDDVLELALRSGHRRIPLYEDSLENVIGVVRLRDIVEARRGEADLRSLATTPMVVPETKRISGLLADMQDQRNHLAIVVDEYGTTVGLVTIEDVVSQLLGSIADDSASAPIVELEPDHWRVEGAALTEDLEIVLGVDLPEGEWNTVAGMMLGVEGRLLGPGEFVEIEGIRFEVEAVEGRRISKISVTR